MLELVHEILDRWSHPPDRVQQGGGAASVHIIASPRSRTRIHTDVNPVITSPGACVDGVVVPFRGIALICSFEVPTWSTTFADRMCT